MDHEVVVLGGDGMIGSAVRAHFESLGKKVLSLGRNDYQSGVGAHARIFANCNGNPYRYKANADPRWDFEASVVSVERTFRDFHMDFYLYISTVDVYPDLSDPEKNEENSLIDPDTLDFYAFHKWLAEEIVQKNASRSAVLRVGTALGPNQKKGPLFDLKQGGPLHMSLDSKLTLVGVETVAKAAAAAAAARLESLVLNVTGTGAARLGDLAEAGGIRPRLAPGAEKVVYDYNINNDRLRSLMQVPSSLEAGTAFLR